MTDNKLTAFVCDAFNIRLSDIFIKTKKRAIQDAKHAACYLMKRQGYTLTHIGKFFGHTSHQPAWRSVKAARDLIHTDQVFREKIIYLESEITRYIFTMLRS